MMTTCEDLNELTTTLIEVTHLTTGNRLTSSSSRGVDYYFECTVLLIGVVGTVANALVLYAMVVSKQHKKQVLIFNQNLLDCVSCFFLSATHMIILCNLDLTGTRGYWLCLMFLTGVNWLGPYIGSFINLSAITIERYLRVVHPEWTNKKLHKWVIYLAVVFAWVAGIVVSAAVNSTTTEVANGICLARIYWKSQAARIAFGIWYLISFYVFILLNFIFCYWRILVIIRHQARIMAVHSGARPDAIQFQLKQTEINIIKTMLLVSVLFAITFAPANVYTFLNHVTKVKVNKNALYAVILIGYLYIVINPFIYATKFDPVRCVLKRMTPCNRTAEPLESIQMT